VTWPHGEKKRYLRVNQKEDFVTERVKSNFSVEVLKILNRARWCSNIDANPKIHATITELGKRQLLYLKYALNRLKNSTGSDVSTRNYNNLSTEYRIAKHVRR